MAQPLPHYLKTHRKRAGLSQEDLAFLLGCREASKISRYERGARQPSLATALAYQAAFNKPVHKLFAGVYRGIKEEVDRRARVLARRLAAASSKS